MSKEANDWKIPYPRKYLVIKYSSPPVTCKCGNCQLVPPEMLVTWDAMITAYEAEIKTLRRKLAGYGDSEGI